MLVCKLVCIWLHSQLEKNVCKCGPAVQNMQFIPLWRKNRLLKLFPGACTFMNSPLRSTVNVFIVALTNKDNSHSAVPLDLKILNIRFCCSKSNPCNVRITWFYTYTRCGRSFFWLRGKQILLCCVRSKLTAVTLVADSCCFVTWPPLWGRAQRKWRIKLLHGPRIPPEPSVYSTHRRVQTCKQTTRINRQKETLWGREELQDVFESIALCERWQPRTFRSLGDDC